MNDWCQDIQHIIGQPRPTSPMRNRENIPLLMNFFSKLVVHQNLIWIFQADKFGIVIRHLLALDSVYGCQRDR